MKTTDGGGHWSESSAGLSADLFIDRLAVDPVSSSNVYAVQSTPFDGRTIIYKSADAGAHWIDIRIIGNHGDFSPAARFARRTFYFDDSFVDFWHFLSKKLDQHARMGP